jgi:hypothetical protein
MLQTMTQTTKWFKSPKNNTKKQSHKKNTCIFSQKNQRCPGRFSLEKEPRYPLERRMGTLHSTSGRFLLSYMCTTSVERTQPPIRWEPGSCGWSVIPTRPIKASLGNLEGGSYTGDVERWKTLGMWHLSPREVYEGSLEGGLLYWLPRRICQVRLWKWTSVSIGAPLWGNMEGRSFPRAFERRDKFL